MHNSNYLFFVVTLFLCTILPNTAIGDLTVNPHGIAVSVDENGQSENELILSNNGDEDITYRFSLIPQELEGRIYGFPLRDERGGPDDATYEWRDDNEEDCPPYEWIDITEFEDVVEIEEIYDDSSAGEYEFEFNVEYYGNEFDRMTIFPNGMIVMGEDPNTIQYFRPIAQWPMDLPTDSAAANSEEPPPNLICVAYQDLNPTVSGNIYFWTDESQAVCTWHEVPHFQDANAENELWTFQIVVEASGLITFQYAEIGMYDNNDIMIGFQNEERDLGFTIIRNDFDYLEAERIIALGPEDAWISWVSVDPTSGEIAGNENTAIEVLFNAEEVDEDGVYYATLRIDIDGVEQEAIEIPMIMSVASPVGAIEGTITNADNDEPIANASVVTEPFGMMRLTDDEGNFEMLTMPVGDYALSCSVTDYLPFIIEDLEVTEDEVADGSMALLHARCIPNREVINVEMEANDEVTEEFTITNDGNGTLEYTVEKRLEGGGDAEPWELRESYAISEIIRDSRVEGAIFADDHFFISGANIMGGDIGENMIYKVNKDGDEIDRFEQFGESRYGMRDMAFDGELIWATADWDVIGFTTDGDSVTTFEGPEGSLNAMAWDPDRERLWMARKTGHSIFAYQRDGEEDDDLELENNGLRIYGMAYWPDDPDGYQLYIVSYFQEGQEIYKMNIENGDTMFVRELQPDQSGNAAGMMISNKYDPLSWVMISIVNDGAEDRLNVWQIEGRQDWMSLEPNAGEINADSEQQFELGIDTDGFPALEIGGELLFTHNGVGYETSLPFNINVLDVEENQPPSDFNLLEPEDSTWIYCLDTLTFAWEESIDPDPDDEIMYRLYLSEDTLDISLVYEMQDTTFTMIPDTAGLNGGCVPIFVFWFVEAISGEDTVECINRFFLGINGTGGCDLENGLPKEFVIQKVYPNPFNAHTTINYTLNKTVQTSLTVYDLLGREAVFIDYGAQQAGWYKAVIDASALPSGIYIVNLRAGSEIRTVKIMCIK